MFISFSLSVVPWCLEIKGGEQREAEEEGRKGGRAQEGEQGVGQAERKVEETNHGRWAYGRNTRGKKSWQQKIAETKLKVDCPLSSVFCQLTYVFQDLRMTEEELENVRKMANDFQHELRLEQEAKEDLEKKLKRLESDKKDQEREIEGLRVQIDELKNVGSSSEAEGSDVRGGVADEMRIRELEDNVRVKNKQIHQLLEDIEQVSNNWKNRNFQNFISEKNNTNIRVS